jgi:nicotinamidase-related amidase
MTSALHSSESPLSFGQHYAVLNLDWMSLLVDGIKDTTVGREFITNCSVWNDAVHQKDPRPLTIFTTLFFSNPSQPELAEDSPFTRLLRGYGKFEKGSPGVQISSQFTVDEKDIILQKTRWYAGAGNNLEQILRAQNIDTVIIVCNQGPSVYWTDHYYFSQG